ncbi:hypothetical protein BCR44DRAFT_1442653 [Catenaria anguillulae PL171]|uniref:Uncharacterized protein n=1 Tax=Catenaria anguillulae PL171 TaxID=765915 RepID=A0A1Y2H9Y8_9FUNG|nr:hypothetical protein BCR44DRAFT_1442653 [Catenaria anguillulae PL171]
MTVLRALHGAHAGHVQSVSWSRSGRFLASGGADWQCFVWDVTTGQTIAEYRFDSPVTNVAFHPIKRNSLIVSLAKSIPVIVSTDDPTARTPLFAAVPQDHASAAAADPNQTNSLDQLDVLATWDPLGRFILCGTSKGHWTVLDASSLAPVFHDKLAASAIREFSLSPCGNHLAITVADKTIRVYMLPYVQTAAAVSHAGNQMEDVIKFDRGEYVIGATSGRTHALCIWGESMGMVSFVVLSHADIWLLLL